MKFTLTILTLLFGVLTFATPQVYFDYKVFHTPDQHSFISTSLQFVGGSFKFEGDESGDLNASVEIIQLFTQDDKIVMVDKYFLDSPIMKDSTVSDFYDVRRYALDPGVYSYELTIKDVLTGESITGVQEVIIEDINPNEISISDIEFIEDAYPTKEKNNFTKNGFFILPYLTNYFPPEIDKIAFYSEVYNTSATLGENEKFLMTCSVEDYKTGETIEGIFNFKKMNTATVNPSIMTVSIANLNSGDYNLKINLFDKNSDTLLTKTVFFQRRSEQRMQDLAAIGDIEIDPSFKNSIAWDSVPYYLGSLYPISQRYDRENIRKLLKAKDTSRMQNYFFAYWKETSPNDPERGCYHYRRQVNYTEKLFGTVIKYGWETDRGRIHLQYGAPDAAVDRLREAETPAYQIWQYYRIDQRSNVRFIFYNPSRATNDYPLLHSDMQGETSNPKWQEILFNKNTNGVGNAHDPDGIVDPRSQSGTLFERGF